MKPDAAAELPDADGALLRPAAEGALCWEGNARVSAPLRRIMESAATPGERLLALAGEAADGELPGDLPWWRGLAREFMARLCRMPGLTDSGALNGPPLPPPDWLARHCASAPPVRGMEFVSAGLLTSLWAGMAAAFATRTTQAGGDVAAALRGLHPVWRTVGRITLHLAENRRDPLRPFAFLATWTERLNDRAQAEHIPLARALQRVAEDAVGLQQVLAPLQSAAQRSPLLRALLESRRLFQALPWSPEDAYAFLQEVPALEASGLVVKVPDWWKAGRPPAPSVQVTLGGAEEGGSPLGGHSLVRFQVQTALGDTPLTPEEVQAILTSEAPLISLKGQWIEPDRERLRQALGFWAKASAAHRQGVPMHLALRWLAGWRGEAAGAAPEQAADHVNAGPQLETWLAALRETGDPHREDPPPAGLRAVLRPYQAAGLAWLTRMTSAGLGACLADDMGLGKTVQLIALLLRRQDQRHAAGAPDRPSLIVAPASLLTNWRRELETFAPSLRCLTAHRSAMSAEELARVAAGRHPALATDAIFLTTYGTLGRLPALTDSDPAVSPVLWDLAVLDEAQVVKNAGTAQARTVHRIQAAARVALTGTPVENRVSDLWSLFAFLNPGLLGSADEFTARVRAMATATDGYAPLRRLVRPFLLRRVKTDPGIAPDLPGKTEVTAWCSLTKKQALLYQRAVAALTKELAGAGEQENIRQAAVLAALLKFKQICNHPSQWSGDGAWDPEDSGKFARLRELAAAIADAGEKVLVFTQFRETTAPLATFLAGVFGRPGLILHGGVAVGRRGELVRQFQEPGGPPFFVISVKAGGTGLNLTAASHVIHFDRWWNPAVEDQATDRAFRIGQTRPVLVHKFVCRGTLEERIDALIRKKRTLAGEIVAEADGAAGLLAKMSVAELLDTVALG